MKRFLSLIVLLGLFTVACTKKASTGASGTQDNKEAVSASKPDQSAEGKVLFDAKCGKCHGLPDPAQYTSQEWRPIMQKMSYKAQLTPEEKTSVMFYVMRNAKSVK